MKISGIDISDMLLSVAAQLAHMDSGTQAAFFNVFAEELEYCCETNYNFNIQGSYVAEESSDKFKQFCEQVSYKEQD